MIELLSCLLALPTALAVGFAGGWRRAKSVDRADSIRETPVHQIPTPNGAS